MTTALPLDADSSPALPPAAGAVHLRLSVMMLLQYAVWGVWLPYIASYLQKKVEAGGLGFTPGQNGWILGLALAIGAVAAPFIAGQVADRYLNAERALALLLLAGGVLNLVLARVHGFVPFLLVSIAYSVVYMPTLSLTNSIAFQNLPDAERQFPRVRLWGTVGWVVASIGFTKLWLTSADVTVNTRHIADALTVSGVLSIGYAAFALLMLPRTPPKRGADPLAVAKAFGLLRNPAFLVVTLVALPVAMIHQVYFFRASLFFEDVVGVKQENFGPVLAIGQASEVVFLLLLPAILKRVGYKGVLILGCLAYAARFGLFGLGHPGWLMIASQALHGLCYGCFFAGSFLLVEKIAGDDIRHSAQTVYGIIILGVGPILAGVYNQYVLGRFQTPLPDGTAAVHYGAVWATQAAVAMAAAVVLAVAFHYRPAGTGHRPTAAAHHDGQLA